MLWVSIQSIGGLMFQIVVQSFVRGEVTVGIVLTLLIISGRSEPHTLAYSLGGIAIFLLLQGLIPVSKRGPGRLLATGKTQQAQRLDTKSGDDDPRAPQPAADRPTTISPCACSQKPFNRREHFIRAATSSFVMIGTACLIYWFAPPIA